MKKYLICHIICMLLFVLVQALTLLDDLMGYWYLFTYIIGILSIWNTINYYFDYNEEFKSKSKTCINLFIFMLLSYLAIFLGLICGLFYRYW